MLQSKLGYYGTRWGCWLATVCSVAETERGMHITDREADSIIGRIHRSRSILLSNYHNNQAPYTRDGFQNEWASFNDENWHFCFHKSDSLSLALHDVFDALAMIKQLKQEYRALIVATQYSKKDTKGSWTGTHCVLELENGDIINPDPSLKIIDRVYSKAITF